MQNKILLLHTLLTFVVVCCITASGFKVMLFRCLVEKACTQFDSCREKKKNTLHALWSHDWAGEITFY